MDYGAGNLRNAAYLTDCGASVWAVDIPAQMNRTVAQFSERVYTLAHYGEVASLATHPVLFSGALCTYVLNILSPSERNKALGLIRQRLLPGAFLCVEVSRRNLHTRRNAFTSEDLLRITSAYGFRLHRAWAGRKWLAHLYIVEKRDN